MDIDTMTVLIEVVWLLFNCWLIVHRDKQNGRISGDEATFHVVVYAVGLFAIDYVASLFG